jgi:carbonic anhydrase
MDKTSFPERLLAGYRTFATQRLPTEQSRYRELSERGQSPEVMVIGCCDSRVSPEVIFDAEPGELFVVRNVANIVPPYAPDGQAHGVSAALEFGVQMLRVKHIVVLGHAQCGGIRALAQEDAAPLSPGDFIGRWMALLTPTLQATPRKAGEIEQDFITRLEKAAVRRSLDNLMTFPCISILANRGSLKLHGAYFGVAKGSLSVLDNASGEFKAVNGAA